ncbi:MAG: hypothetical protein U1A78_21905 [Polyangia bacterium]
MRSLRPLGFALLFLALLEGALRVLCDPDPRVLRDPLHPYGCFADAEQERLLRARAADAAPGAKRDTEGAEDVDVVLLGDSVLASTDNAPGERLSDALSQALPAALTAAAGGGKVRAPQVRVYTLAEGGARAADQYAALRRLAAGLAALPAAAAGAPEASVSASGHGRRPLVILLSSNVLFYSQRHRQPALLFPCLGDWLDDEPELRARLGLPAPAAGALLDRIERRLTVALTRGLYLFQQRRRVSERLFGGDGLPPRQALRERLVASARRLHGSPSPSTAGEDVALRNRPWSERGLKPSQFRAHYDLVPPGAPEATNLLASAHLARYLGAHPELPVTVVELAQNHALVGPWTASPAYAALQDGLAARFTAAGVRVLRYDRHPALRSNDFIDQDHLSAEGNRRLAALLAADLAPRLLAELSGRSDGTSAPSR